MFVEHKEVGEAHQAPAKVLKLSEAIKAGCKYIPESRSFFNGDARCAICTGAQHLGMEINDGAWRGWRVACRWLAFKTRTPFDLISAASARHYTTTDSREQIADWLEAQGY